MQKRAVFFLIVLSLAVSLFSLNPANLNNVVVLNRTGYEIEFLFISPADSDHWAADVLGFDRTLENNDSLGFYLHYPEECNDFDIMAIDADGDVYYIWDFTICDERKATITITDDDLSDDTSDDMGLTSLEIMNTTGVDMEYFFLSPNDSEMWGVDLLDEESYLLADESVTFYIPTPSEPFDYEFLTLDEDENHYQFTLEIDPDVGESQYIEVESSDLITD